MVSADLEGLGLPHHEPDFATNRDRSGSERGILVAGGDSDFQKDNDGGDLSST